MEVDGGSWCRANSEMKALPFECKSHCLVTLHISQPAFFGCSLGNPRVPLEPRLTSRKEWTMFQWREWWAEFIPMKVVWWLDHEKTCRFNFKLLEPVHLQYSSRFSIIVTLKHWTTNSTKWKKIRMQSIMFFSNACLPVELLTTSAAEVFDGFFAPGLPVLCWVGLQLPKPMNQLKLKSAPKSSKASWQW